MLGWGRLRGLPPQTPFSQNCKAPKNLVLLARQLLKLIQLGERLDRAQFVDIQPPEHLDHRAGRQVEQRELVVGPWSVVRPPRCVLRVACCVFLVSPSPPLPFSPSR